MRKIYLPIVIKLIKVIEVIRVIKSKPLITIITLITLCTTAHAQFTNVMIDNQNAPEEPSIAISLVNTSAMIAGSNTHNYYYSSNVGATWSKNSLNSTYGEAGDPCTRSDSSGNFYYFHLVNNVDRVVCQKSTNGGATYNNGAYTTDNMTKFQDKEWGAVDPHTGAIYITWTEYDNGFNPQPTDSSNIYFSKSTDGGASFTPGLRINEHQGDCLYVDITDPHPFVGPNGEVYATFMDSVGIRFNKSTDGGNTWLVHQPVVDSAGPLRYNSVFGVNRIRTQPYSECDRSNSPYRGNIYVSFADQRNGVNNSDVFFVKSSDGGTTWSPAIKVNQDASRLQQYRQALAVDQTNGYIYIVYYDRRNHPANDSTDVYMSRSIDGGSSWTDFKISSSPFYSDGSTFDGDYIDISAHAGIVRPIWTRVTNNSSTGVWTALFNESTLGITVANPEGLNPFSVNPNPANVVAVVSFENEEANLQGYVYDASGRMVLPFTVNHEREKILDTSHLSAGMYFVKAGANMQKLLIEK